MLKHGDVFTNLDSSGLYVAVYRANELHYVALIFDNNKPVPEYSTRSYLKAIGHFNNPTKTKALFNIIDLYRSVTES